MADTSPTAVHVHDVTRGRFGNQERIEVCRPAVGAPRLDHLSYQVNGSQDFTIDALDERLGGNEAGRTRQLLSGLGKQLPARFAEFDEAIRSWQSGTLIRLVLHGAKRLVVCNAVTAEQLLVTSAPVAPDASLDTALEPDRVTAALTDKLRDMIKLPSRDPGGFQHEMPSDGFLPSKTEELSEEATESENTQEPCRHSHASGASGPVADLLCRSATADDLHYAAYIRSGKLHCTADVLEHPSLGAFFNRITTADVRRSAYETFAARLCTGPGSLLGQLTLEVEDLIGEITRIVVDVEQGAFYCYRLGDDDFALGVTLDQHRVTEADRRMYAITKELAG
jgi:hypothetical protein